VSNPALLHLPLRGNLDGRDRNGILTATAVGPVRFTADGYYAEEATTNYITNPRMANGTGWVPGQWTAAWNQTDRTREGVPSVKLTMPAEPTGTPYLYQLQAVSPSQVWSHRWYVYTELTGRRARGQITWRDSGGATIGSALLGTDTTLVPGQWTEVKIENQAAPALSVSALMMLHFVSSTYDQGDVVWICQPQLEQKAYLTSYADGSLGTGYSWSGAVHASASTRVAASLSFNPIGRLLPTQGEIWVRVAYGPVVGTLAQYAFLHIHNGANRLYILRLMSTDELRVGLGANGNTGPGYTHADGALVTQALGWNGTAYTHLVNGTVVASGTVSAGTTELGTIAYIGSNSTSQQINGYISDVMIFDRPLTDAERATLIATPEWSFGVLRPKIGGLLRIGMSMGLAISSVAAIDPIAILRAKGDL
jgi:hypothetical protein